MQFKSKLLKFSNKKCQFSSKKLHGCFNGSPCDNVKNSERLINLIDFVIDEKKRISDVKDIYEKLCSLYSNELYSGDCKKYLDSIGINQLLLLAQLLKEHSLSDDFEIQDKFYKRIDSHVRRRVGKYCSREE